MLTIEQLDKNALFLYQRKWWGWGSNWGTYFDHANGRFKVYLSINGDIEELNSEELIAIDYVLSQLPNPFYIPKVSLKEIYANY